MAAARVVEHAVENEAHPALVDFVDELPERVLAAQHRVHLHEVAGMVPVVGGG